MFFKPTLLRTDSQVGPLAYHVAITNPRYLGASHQPSGVLATEALLIVNDMFSPSLQQQWVYQEANSDSLGARTYRKPFANCSHIVGPAASGGLGARAWTGVRETGPWPSKEQHRSVVRHAIVVLTSIQNASSARWLAKKRLRNAGNNTLPA